VPPKPLTLAVTLLSCVAWIIFGFAVPVGVGIVHALLAVSSIMFVRWWGLVR